MDRFTVERDHVVFYIEDQGWLGGDCPKDAYPKPAIELRFKTLQRAQTICNIMNAEWAEFERNPS